MLVLRSKIKYTTICFHREQELVKKFSLQQINLSSPFNIYPNKQKAK